MTWPSAASAMAKTIRPTTVVNIFMGSERFALDYQQVARCANRQGLGAE
jgi:hypothetical protein